MDETTFKELDICSVTIRRLGRLAWFAEALRNSNLERVRSNRHPTIEAALEELRAMLSGAPVSGYVGCAKTTVSLGGHTTELIIVPPSGELGSPLPVKP
jgi:hypothetical protein